MSKPVKTTEYNQFKFRDDNRVQIDMNHVKRLEASISQRNLTEFRPITVNEKMEIVDGQHRFLACKNLGFPIYYQVIEDSNPIDLININVVKTWTAGDYINYWAKQGNLNYIKLQNVIKQHNISPSLAIEIFKGDVRKSRDNFKNGLFIFDEQYNNINSELFKNTANIIKTHSLEKQHNLSFLNTLRFHRALYHVSSLPNFDEETWYTNLRRYTHLMTVKPTVQIYIDTILKIYNYNAKNKLTNTD